MGINNKYSKEEKNIVKDICVLNIRTNQYRKKIKEFKNEKIKLAEELATLIENRIYKNKKRFRPKQKNKTYFKNR